VDSGEGMVEDVAAVAGGATNHRHVRARESVPLHQVRLALSGKVHRKAISDMPKIRSGPLRGPSGLPQEDAFRLSRAVRTYCCSL
jgi:hypothetical protein